VAEAEALLIGGTAVMDGRALVDEVGRRSPDVVLLAELASAAAVIEPALLRLLRRQLLPTLDAGVEADLWFSGLAQVATATTLTLRPEAAQVLRDRLATDPALAAAARRVIERAHRGHTELVRLEERIVWAHVSRDPAGMAYELDRMLATLHLPDRAPDVVRWYGQARRRLPAAALASPSGQRLLAAVAMHLDRVVPTEVLAADRFPDAVADVAPSGLPHTAIGVELVGGGLRFVDPDAAEAATAAELAVPLTRPLVLEARWALPSGEPRSAVVRAEPGTAVELPGLATDAERVEVRTLAGRRFALRSVASREVVLGAFASVPDRWIGDAGKQLEDLAVRIRRVSEPVDLAERPEVLVLDGLIAGLTAQRRAVVDSFLRLATRPDEPGGNRPSRIMSSGTGPAPLVITGVGPLTVQESAVAAVVVSGVGPGVVPEADPALAAVADRVLVIGGGQNLAAAIRAVVRHPRRLYDLDVASALEMLQAIALAFHVRSLYREEVPESAEPALFGLPDDLSRASFDHVRLTAEYVFSGPVTGYLAGGLDPSRPDPESEPARFEGLESVDPLSEPYRLGWSPAGESWPSCEAYLAWWLDRLHHYLVLLRDRLPPRTLNSGFGVPAEVLDRVRLCLGTHALPPGSDVPRASTRPDDLRPQVEFRVVRENLPGLVAALTRVLLPAVRAEDAARAAAPSPEVSPEPPGSASSAGSNPGVAETAVDWQAVATFQVDVGPIVRHLGWLPEPGLLAVAGDSGIAVVDPSDGEMLQQRRLRGGVVAMAAWSRGRDAGVWYAPRGDRAVHFLGAGDERERPAVVAPDEISALAATPGGPLVIGTVDGGLSVLDPDSQHLQPLPLPARRAVRAIATGPDSVATITEDGSLTLVRLDPGRKPVALARATGDASVTCFAHLGGRAVLVFATGPRARLWEAESGDRLPGRLDTGEEVLIAMAGAERWLAGLTSKGVVFWYRDDAPLPVDWYSLDGVPAALAAAGNRLAIGFEGGTVQIISGQPLS
jgi:hypothetical protein